MKDEAAQAGHNARMSAMTDSDIVAETRRLLAEVERRQLAEHLRPSLGRVIYADAVRSGARAALHMCLHIVIDLHRSATGMPADRCVEPLLETIVDVAAAESLAEPSLTKRLSLCYRAAVRLTDMCERFSNVPPMAAD